MISKRIGTDSQVLVHGCGNTATYGDGTVLMEGSWNRGWGVLVGQASRLSINDGQNARTTAPRHITACNISVPKCVSALSGVEVAFPCCALDYDPRRDVVEVSLRGDARNADGKVGRLVICRVFAPLSSGVPSEAQSQRSTRDSATHGNKKRGHQSCVPSLVIIYC